VVLCVEGADDAPEDHVDGCGDEGGRAEDEDLLEGPGADCCSVFVGPGSAVVAEGFAWWVSTGIGIVVGMGWTDIFLLG
jgi:hypothetical protein